MKNKLREVTLTEEQMKAFTAEIRKDTSNSGIFSVIRGIQEEVTEVDTKIINIGSLYWYLIDYRDRLRAG